MNARTFATICLIAQAILPTLGIFHEQPMSVAYAPHDLENDSFFGYSMAYLDKKIIVSAPADRKVGTLYQFHLTNNTNSFLSPIDTSSILDTGEVQEGQWLGATLKSVNSTLVTCAPRYALYNNDTNDKGKAMKIMQGQCFLREGDKWSHLQDINVYGRTLFNHGMDSFGWSIDINDDQRIMIGSPVIESNAVIFYSEPYSHTSPEFLLFKSTGLHNFDAPCKLTNETKYNHSLKADLNTTVSYHANTAIMNSPAKRGYSIVNGKFLSDDAICSAVGSTYETSGFGTVHIFSDKRKVDSIRGDTVGSMFGAVLAIAKLGGKRDSLLIGAPSYSTGDYAYNRGAVYLYVPSDVSNTKKTLIFKRVIKGEENGGFFGHAIASLEDLNGDHIDDVAIGAPYEVDGIGAVYIYSGAQLLREVNVRPLQKLQAAGSQFFGFNLVPICNSFEAGLTELAVSALNSNVYVYESVPVITVKLSGTIENLQNWKTLGYVVYKTSINVDYPIKPNAISTVLNVKLNFTHPNAKLENATSDGIFTKTIRLDKKTKSYTNQFKLLTPIDGDYSRVVKYAMSVDLVDEPAKPDKINKGRVTLSVNSDLSKSGEVWIPDCKLRDICKPNLSGNFISKMPEIYSAGFSETEKFSLAGLNSGETAYTACIMVNVRGARVIRSSDCFIDGKTGQLVWKPQSPIRTNQKWKTGDIELEMNLNSTVKNIIIEYTIYNNCSNKMEKETHEKSIKVVHDANVHITGISTPSAVVNMTNVDQKDSTQLRHHYVINNNGNTIWVDAECKVTLPKKDYLQYPQNYITIPKGESTQNCSLDEANSNSNYFVLLCYLGNLNKNEKKEISVYIEVLNTIGDTIKLENVNVSTELTLQLQDHSISKSITTTLVLEYVSVPVWIIIVTIIIALLVFFLLCCVLHKYGCFERKNKKKLEMLKKQRDENMLRENEADPTEDGNYRILEEE